MRTWWAVIRLQNGNQQRVTIQADSYWNARLMLESLYGKQSVLFGLNPVDLMRVR